MSQDLGGIGNPSGVPRSKRFKSLQERLEELRREGASAEQIAAELRRAGFGGESIAKALKEKGVSALDVIGALQALNIPLQAIVHALKKADFSGEQVAKALSKVIVCDPKPRVLRPEEIAKLMHGAGYEPKEIVEGLVAIHCPDQTIVDILVGLKIHKDEIIKAMKKAGFSETFIRKELERATGRPADSWPAGKYSLKQRAGL